tara:strand:+ start:111 stop:686 length:576 start_codon:yes stop_codon:yes gene_type:complete
MAFVNSLDWNQLQPIFVCGADSNVLDDKVFISNGGSTITAANGNNGQSMNAYVKGVARGSFKIQFKLGYTWGYSRFYMANSSIISQSSPNDGNYASPNANGLRFMNNNSNNVLLVDKNVNGTTSQILNTTGVSDTMITLWRDTSNVVKYKVGSAATTTVGTFTDIFVFGVTLQSPASCELIMAMGLAEAPS